MTVHFNVTCGDNQIVGKIFEGLGIRKLLAWNPKIIILIVRPGLKKFV